MGRYVPLALALASSLLVAAHSGISTFYGSREGLEWVPMPFAVIAFVCTIAMSISYGKLEDEKDRYKDGLDRCSQDVSSMRQHMSGFKKLADSLWESHGH